MAAPVWPGGARCAVNLTFDNFGEARDIFVHGHAHGALADGVYAPRLGVRRILDLLDEHQVKATFFPEGWSAQKYAPLLREVVARGHEVGAHGWMHEDWDKLDSAKERELIARTTTAIEDAIGQRPLGWRCPGGLMTPRTLLYVQEAGYFYDSSFTDHDWPYVIGIGPRKPTLVELPWSWTLDDAPYYMFPRTLRPPGEVLEIWREEFDTLYPGGYFMLTCHPRFSGRPARLGALDKLIGHIEQQPGVWFATCLEVARATEETGERVEPLG